MRYFVIILICLSLMITTSAYAKGPTINQTVDFIKEKIQQHGVKKFYEDMCDIQSLPCRRKSFDLRVDSYGNLIYSQENTCYKNDSDITVNGQSDWDYSIPINRVRTEYRYCSSPCEYGDRYSILVYDVEESKTIQTDRYFHYYIKEMTKWAKRDCNYKWSDSESISRKQHVIAFYFDEEIQAKKVEKALDHLIKLAKEKWPVKKELF